VRFHPLPSLQSRPLVSVVIPCYRYGNYLATAVDTAIRQPGVRVEVIVVDDASPDDSAEVARELAGRHPEVTAVVHEANRGHIATYNDGLERATGDYVVLLSADDLLAPGALARAAAIMDRDPEVGLVYGFAPDFEQSPAPTRRLLPHYARWTGEQWIDRVCASAQNPVCTPTAIMRRQVLTACGGYDPRLPHTADLLMWLRAAGRAGVAYVSGVDQAYYRVHGSNMHSTTFAQLAVDLEQRREAFRVFLTEFGGDPARSAARLSTVTHALVVEAERALHRLDPAEPGSAEAAEALTDLIERHREPRPGTARRPAAPAPWAARADAARGMLDWRYWRRFGLRL